jgi:hypothetical protein
MPRKRELVGSPAPRGLEIELRRALRPMLAQVKATLPKIKTLGDARALGAALRKAWPEKRLRAIVGAIFLKVGVRGAVGWGKWERKAEALAAARKTKSKRGDAAPEDLIERWTREAVAKITNVRDEVAEALRRDIVAAHDLGMTAADLQAEWARNGVPTSYGSLEGRLKVISQHQIASLNAAIQAERAGSIGATDFVWIHSDQTVEQGARPIHVERHGLTFPYSFDELPGTLPNCNCYAEAVIPVELTIPIGSAFDT